MKSSQKWNPVDWHEDTLPYAPDFQDHYYSRHDGCKESEHVFIQGNNLPERWSKAAQDLTAQQETHFFIGELGFGTGLNFLHTWQCWQKYRKENQYLHFISFEGFPIKAQNAARALAPWPQLAASCALLMQHWSTLFSPHTQKAAAPPVINMDEQTSLQIFYGPVDEMLPHLIAYKPTEHQAHDWRMDAWYLDGFSPAKNPEMWSAPVLNHIGQHTKQGGTCTSYTAAGWVRRNLENAGFHIEKRPGFGSKRDMIFGIKP